MAMGVITADEAKVHPKRHVISQYLGMPTDEVSIEPTLSAAYEGKPGDCYLLCSDGLTDMLDNSTIEYVLARSKDMKTAALSLVQNALSRGGRDNVTALCLCLPGGRCGNSWTFLQKTILCGGILSSVFGLALLAELVFRLL